MALELIVGPPNSNRAGAVLDRLRGALDRDPVLVVPTGDDIVRFERDLCADGGAPGRGDDPHLRVALRRDRGLTATPVPPRLSPPQRLALVRAAVASTDLRVLRRSSGSPGFAPALDTLIAELQAALVSPADLRPRPTRRKERPRRSVSSRDSMPSTSACATVQGAPTEARSRQPRQPRFAPSRTPGATRQCSSTASTTSRRSSSSLIAVLSGVCEVTFAVNYSDRNALAARAGLLTRLTDEGGSVIERARVRHGLHGRELRLAHIARNIFESDSGTVNPLDGGLALPRQRRRARRGRGGRGRDRPPAGRRSERRRHRRHASPPIRGWALVRVRHARDGHSRDARGRICPLAATAVGRSLLALCRAAADDGEPADVIAHLRADAAFRPSRADWKERDVARGKLGSVAELDGDAGVRRRPRTFGECSKPAARSSAYARSP